MKPIFKYILFAAFFLFSLSGYYAYGQQKINTNGYNKFYYENGNISSEGTMRNGKPDGYWITYFSNGKIKSEGNRKNYELDSTWKFYDTNGLLVSEINYINGKKNGIKRTWSSEKYIISEEKFSEDLKGGETIIYYPSADSMQIKGKIKFKMYFDKGKEHGFSYEFSKEGQIITVSEYVYGVLKKQDKINRTDEKGLKQGVWREFYETGKIKEETTFLNGKKTGYSKTFSPTGSLVNIDKYSGDSLQKQAPELTTNLEVKNEYYEDGSIKKTGTYLFGLAEGIHKEYSREGKITSAKIYKEDILAGEGLMDEAGKRQGAWVEYHANEKIKAKGVYENGVRTGSWIFYHPNGNTEQTGLYDKKGKAQGLWQWYYESGKPLREETYLNGKREGALTEWSENGNVITKGEYFDGTKEGKWFYEIQDYREEGMYKNDQKDGPWESYFVNNSQVRFAGKFIEGLPDGKHSYYFFDGKLKEEGKYVMGNKDGNWEYYNPDGTVLLTITYKNNKEIKFDGTKVKPLLPGENHK